MAAVASLPPSPRPPPLVQYLHSLTFAIDAKGEGGGGRGGADRQTDRDSDRKVKTGTERG